MKSLNKTTSPSLRRALLCIATLGLSVQVSSASATEEAPPCYGPENYATQIALVELVNTRRVADATSIYRDRTTPYHLRTTLLDSQRIGRFSGPGMPETDVYRQIQKIEVRTRSGDAFILLTISEVSVLECSLSAPTVVMMQPEYVVLRVGGSVSGAVN
ncbi:hypothetical protein O4G98_12120 [Zoogloeaceae bacterium G21618-S1]|nr:hypothetical protein [Zoogloeaceae bacterium G21618-S1]